MYLDLSFATVDRKLDSIVKYTIYVAGHTYTEVHRIKIISNLNNNPMMITSLVTHTLRYILFTSSSVCDTDVSN